MGILSRNKSYRAASLKGVEGQTTIEFALGMILFIFIILAVIQFGIVVYAQLIVTEAAQEGARLAASADKGINDGIVTAGHNLDTGLGNVEKKVKGSADGNKVIIETSVHIHSFLPFLGPLVKFDLQAKADMYKESWRS
jgi:hypothetical protein